MSTDVGRTRGTGPAWVAWAAGAIAATVAHRTIDQHIGLFGATSTEMSLHQAGAAVLDAALVAWAIFVIVEATLGDGKAVRAALLLIVIHAVVLNGAVAFAAAPPPSDAFPYQDLTHAAALAFGALAARGLWKDRGMGVWGAPAWATVVLIVAAAAVGGTLAVSNL